MYSTVQYSILTGCPLSPGSPFLPWSPVAPSMPLIPAAPRSPGSPSSPFGHGLEFSCVTYEIFIHISIIMMYPCYQLHLLPRFSSFPRWSRCPGVSPESWTPSESLQPQQASLTLDANHNMTCQHPVKINTDTTD